MASMKNNKDAKEQSTEQIWRIRKGGLYAPLPIPAFQVLAKAEERAAQKVLLALVMHMGYQSNCVFPSYNTIASTVGIGRSAISQGLTVLYEFGFIKIARFPQGKQWRSKYYLQPACWDTSFMNEKSIKFRHKTAVCIDCGELLDNGGYGVSRFGTAHWGCGGKVISVSKRYLARE
jgi:hypothetical protein